MTEIQINMQSQILSKQLHLAQQEQDRRRQAAPNSRSGIQSFPFGAVPFSVASPPPLRIVAAPASEPPPPISHFLSPPAPIPVMDDASTTDRIRQQVLHMMSVNESELSNLERKLMDSQTQLDRASQV